MLRALVFASVAALAVGVNAHASTFGLENSIGATPTFSIVSGGATVTYSSPSGNGFAVQDTSGLLSFHTALLDNNFFNEDPLTLSFSSPISGTIVIPFAILNSYSTAESLTVTTNTGQTMSFLAGPDALALGEPEGVARFALTGPVTSISLNGTNAFAIGDVSTTPVAATPEPTSILLLATGLAGIASRRKNGSHHRNRFDRCHCGGQG